MNGKWIVKRVKQNIFGEFEVSKPKTSLAKYLKEFNDFSEPQCPHRKTVFEAVKQTFLHIHALYVKRFAGRIHSTRKMSPIVEISF